MPRHATCNRQHATCNMPCAACSMLHTTGVPLQLHAGRPARGGRVRGLGGRRVATAAGAPLHGVPRALPACLSDARARLTTRAARGRRFGAVHTGPFGYPMMTNAPPFRARRLTKAGRACRSTRGRSAACCNSPLHPLQQPVAPNLLQQGATAGPSLLGARQGGCVGRGCGDARSVACNSVRQAQCACEVRRVRAYALPPALPRVRASVSRGEESGGPFSACWRPPGPPTRCFRPALPPALSPTPWLMDQSCLGVCLR